MHYHVVRVNSISPGWIDVSGMKKSSEAKQAKLSKEDYEQHPVYFHSDFNSQILGW